MDGSDCENVLTMSTSSQNLFSQMKYRNTLANMGESGDENTFGMSPTRATQSNSEPASRLFTQPYPCNANHARTCNQDRVEKTIVTTEGHTHVRALTQINVHLRHPNQHTPTRRRWSSEPVVPFISKPGLAAAEPEHASDDSKDTDASYASEAEESGASEAEEEPLFPGVLESLLNHGVQPLKPDMSKNGCLDRCSCGLLCTSCQTCDSNLSVDWEACKDYRLIITGHSLGAGIAAVLAILLRPKYGNRVYAYPISPPGGLLSLDCAKRTDEYMTSVLLGDDMISRLSIHTMEKLRDEVVGGLISNKRTKTAIWVSAVPLTKTAPDLRCTNQ